MRKKNERFFFLKKAEVKCATEKGRGKINEYKRKRKEVKKTTENVYVCIF